MSQIQASPAEAKPGAVPCPRCQQPLVDPNGIGWCQACGYSHAMAESTPKTPEPAQPAAAPSNTITATGSAIGQTPTWFWVSAIGVIMIVGATVALGHYLKLSPFERALLATVQIAAGIMALFVGQFIGVMRIASEDLTLTFFDVVIPFRLYGLVFKRLPSSRHTVYLAAWGLAAIISAAIFIGGLDHWTKYLPHNQKNAQKK